MARKRKLGSQVQALAQALESKLKLQPPASSKSVAKASKPPQVPARKHVTERLSKMSQSNVDMLVAQLVNRVLALERRLMSGGSLEKDQRECALRLGAALIDPFNIHDACLMGSAPINTSFGTSNFNVTFTTNATKCTVVLISPQWIFNNTVIGSENDPSGAGGPTGLNYYIAGATVAVYVPAATGVDGELSMHDLMDYDNGSSTTFYACSSQFSYNDWDKTVSFGNNVLPTGGLPVNSNNAGFPAEFNVNQGKLESYRVVSSGWRLSNDTPIMSGVTSQIDNFTVIQSHDHCNILDSETSFDSLIVYPNSRRFRGVPMDRVVQENWYQLRRNEYEVAKARDVVQTVSGQNTQTAFGSMIDSEGAFDDDQCPFLIFSDLSCGASGAAGPPVIPDIDAQVEPKYFAGQIAYVFAPSALTQTYILDGVINYEYVTAPSFAGGYAPGISLKPAGLSQSSSAVTAVVKHGGTSFSDKVKNFTNKVTPVIKGVGEVAAVAGPAIKSVKDAIALFSA